MKRMLAYRMLLLAACLGSSFAVWAGKHPGVAVFYRPDHPAIRYVGRIDFSNPVLPRFWSPGVYIQVAFKGSTCSVILNDELLWGNTHNYVEIAVDNEPSYRVQLKGKTDTLHIPTGSSKGIHRLTLCKDTESGIGYLELAGLMCDQLLPLPAGPLHTIELIGDSITCGTGSDLSGMPCGKGRWEDQHNAYKSYGAVAARRLDAQWVLSSVSGIGMIHSCCNLNITMPQVFDKVNMRANALPWNFNNYTPDVVTVCLGQNDGIQDSAAFCNAYLQFLERLRQYYPAATILCLSSPMADATLLAALKHYLNGIVAARHAAGDVAVYAFSFSRRFSHGCDQHPDVEEQAIMGQELARFIRKLKYW